MARLNLKDFLFYALLIVIAYYVVRQLLTVREGFQPPGGAPDFCMVTAAVENCRCDDFHPCKNGFTCQNGLCRVPPMPVL
jgi:hypothetical protein